ncbi:hypothetical protein NDU88_002787 [Pleurodeles waltl]|uniref:Reverse transcriptase n=1 Tax=Pleurodeles waltl TaxID=8319 RepID=A0AAV7LL49_PLEWA|nr:hypothetical protein NDU88_002787 [Pleurodeles waltl]
MPPRSRVRDRFPTQIGTPTSLMAARESGGNWDRAALEVRRVRALTSGVALRGATGGVVGRGSTSRRGSSRGMLRETLPPRRGKELFPPSQALEDFDLLRRESQGTTDATSQTLRASVVDVQHIPPHLSDHAAVVLTLKEVGPRPVRRWILDRSLLNNTEVVERLSSETKCCQPKFCPPYVVWDSYKAFIRGMILISISAQRNRKYRLEVQNIEKDLENLEGKLVEAQFEGKIEDAIILELAYKRASLSAVIETRVRERWDASKFATFEYGESAGKLLSCKTESDLARNQISEISDPTTGVTLTEPLEIQRAFQGFFEVLHKEDLLDAAEVRMPNVEELMMEKLDGEGQSLVEEDILQGEVAQAISKTNKGKAAGPDGLLAKFYVKLCSVLAPFLKDLFNLI